MSPFEIKVPGIKKVVDGHRLRHAAEIPQIYDAIAGKHDFRGKQRPVRYDPKTHGELDRDGYFRGDGRRRVKTINGYIVGERYNYKHHGSIYANDEKNDIVQMVGGKKYNENRHGEIYEGKNGNYVLVDGKEVPVKERRVIMLPGRLYDQAKHGAIDNNDKVIVNGEKLSVENRVDVVNGQRKVQKYIMEPHVLDEHIPDVHILTQKFMIDIKGRLRNIEDDLNLFTMDVQDPTNIHHSFKGRVREGYEVSGFGYGQHSMVDGMPDIQKNGIPPYLPDTNVTARLEWGRGSDKTLDPYEVGENWSHVLVHSIIGESFGVGVGGKVKGIKPHRKLVTLVKKVFKMGG